MNSVQDVRVPWLNVARRLQSIAPSGGHSILTIKVVVDCQGNPVLWTEPTQVKIEPKCIDQATLLSLLTQDT